MTSSRIRLGFVGAEHLHFGGLLQRALECPTAEVVGFTSTDPELQTHFANLYPDVRAFASSTELYERAEPQAIITCADNLRAAEVVAEAAGRGRHVMKE